MEQERPLKVVDVTVVEPNADCRARWHLAISRMRLSRAAKNTVSAYRTSRPYYIVKLELVLQSAACPPRPEAII